MLPRSARRLKDLEYVYPGRFTEKAYRNAPVVATGPASAAQRIKVVVVRKL
ncbi:MAG: hypothetical protein AAF517_09285 [Planctomycetota bacterium]